MRHVYAGTCQPIRRRVKSRRGYGHYGIHGPWRQAVENRSRYCSRIFERWKPMKKENIAGEPFTSANDLSREADSYTADQQAVYEQQARQNGPANSQRGRQHMDLNYGTEIGGTQQLKPVNPSYRWARRPIPCEFGNPDLCFPNLWPGHVCYRRRCVGGFSGVLAPALSGFTDGVGRVQQIVDARPTDPL